MAFHFDPIVEVILKAIFQAYWTLRGRFIWYGNIQKPFLDKSVIVPISTPIMIYVYFEG